jgi:hypothetical protein
LRGAALRGAAFFAPFFAGFLDVVRRAGDEVEEVVGDEDADLVVCASPLSWRLN